MEVPCLSEKLLKKFMFQPKQLETCTEGMIVSKISKGGAPRKLDARADRELVRMIDLRQVSSATEATKRLNESLHMNVCPNTVRNHLRGSGMKTYVREKKPLLTEKQISDRYEFAKRYSDLTVDDWREVIFTDESKVNRYGHNGPQKVWLKVPDRYNFKRRPDQAKRSVKYGGGGVMIWGCVGAFGTGRIGRIHGTMDRFVYMDLLERHLLGTLRDHHLGVGDFTFQQDNDTKHTAKDTKAWLAAHHFIVLQWPSNSPDLNPIENVWALLKARLRNQYSHPPRTLDDQWDRVQEQWALISREDVLKVIDSMPDRIQAVLEARGNLTRY